MSERFWDLSKSNIFPCLRSISSSLAPLSPPASPPKLIHLRYRQFLYSHAARYPFNIFVVAMLGRILSL
ncbi:hypothetical protein ACN38_g2774 [Penicillium nordicum]|uniref:Uncharacterized protein n=1 Tax=Penicillium nordicum TaxID=229535 RepID=A0A0M8P681_9EURO|nr:hypothetical protein ACN38_g2774 [Penicillium nordicum]